MSKTWFQKLRDNGTGVVLRHNLLRQACFDADIAWSIVANFIKEIGKIDRRKGYPADPEIPFRWCLHDDCARRKPRFVLKGRTIEDRQVSQPSRVMSLRSLTKRHGPSGVYWRERMSETSQLSIIYKTETAHTNGSDNRWVTWEDTDLNLDETEENRFASGLKESNSMPAVKLPYFWVTASRAVRSLWERENVPRVRRVRQLCDALGFYHLTTDVLVEIAIPKNLASGKLHVPSVIDGGYRIAFRPGAMKDGWGRTIELEGWRNSLPEAVSETMFPKAEFAARVLGRLDVPVDSTFRRCELLLSGEIVKQSRIDLRARQRRMIPWQQVRRAVHT